MQAKASPSAPLTILELESSMNWGGQEERLLREMIWFKKHGHRAILACPQSSATFQRAVDAGLDVRPVSMRMNFDLPGFLRLAALVRREKPDIIHTRSSKDAWFGFWFHWFGIPVVRSRHITLAPQIPFGRKLIYRCGSRRLIASAEFIADNMRNVIGISPERVDVIGECVDPEEFHPGDGTAFRNEFGIASDTPLFAVVGMLRGEKGQMTFVRAAREVLRKRPDIRFAVVGGNAKSTRLENNIKDFLKTELPEFSTPPIIMTGFRNDIPAVMRAINCLVVPSLKDAQTLVIPQAFATGKPVIGSRVGGIPELVEDGVNGLLVEPKNYEALAEAMLKIASNPTMAAGLGQAGLNLALQELTADHKMALLLTSYRRAISRTK